MSKAIVKPTIKDMELFVQGERHWQLNGGYNSKPANNTIRVALDYIEYLISIQKEKL